MSSELINKTGHQLRTLLDSKEVSSEELTRAYLARIEAVDGGLNCYNTVTGEVALSMAKDADKRINDGKAGPRMMPRQLPARPPPKADRQRPRVAANRPAAPGTGANLASGSDTGQRERLPPVAAASAPGHVRACRLQPRLPRF